MVATPLFWKLNYFCSSSPSRPQLRQC